MKRGSKKAKSTDDSNPSPANSSPINPITVIQDVNEAISPPITVIQDVNEASPITDSNPNPEFKMMRGVTGSGHKQQELISSDLMMDRCVSMGLGMEQTLTLLSSVYGPNLYVEGDVIRRRKKVAEYVEQLNRLIALPKLEQRTPEWYETRKTLITASDFAQALGDGKFGTQKDLIVKKCGYEEEAAFNATLPPLKWGTMFEPVASMIYESRNRSRLHEFGLLRHPTIPYFGASPDGVNEHGIMVEIKCPFKRKINGEVPLQYYYQIQGQLDVCGLYECDYFECEFVTFDSIDDLEEEEESPLYECGCIVERENMNFAYSPLMTRLHVRPQANQWLDGEREKKKKKEEEIKKIIYYALIRTNTNRVYKDPHFLEEKLDLLKDVWNKIKEYRSDKALYDKEVGPAKATNPKAPSRTFGGFKITGCAF